MDAATMREILSQHPSTADSYQKEHIWAYRNAEGTIVGGVSSEALFVALRALTETAPLYAAFNISTSTYRAIITDPPTSAKTSVGRAENSTIVGGVINNLAPNQGVQGVFTKPITFGKK